MAAPNNFIGNQTNGYTSSMESKTAANSIDIDEGTVLTLVGGSYVTVATSSSVVEGISVTKKTFASDNQTNALGQVIYVPGTKTQQWFAAGIQGTSIVFVGNFVTSNSVTMMVNGVPMTPVVFTTDNATTLAAIATQLTSQFGSVLGTVTASGAHTLLIPTVGVNSSVVITGIAVTLGASQTTGAVTDVIDASSVGKFFNITNTTQLINAGSASTSTGQFRLEIFSNTSSGVFSVWNK